MRIVVPIKQVPDTANVKMDPETGTMIREGLDAIINPLDLYGIELAITLKEQYGGSVTVISMGPLSAEKAIRGAIAMGADDGVLVSDKKFGGSDTWATSYTLAKAIEKLEYDLIICGERATDGDTGQVGPGIAAWLDLPVAGYVARVDELAGGHIQVERLVEEGYQLVRLRLPCVLTVVKEVSRPRLPTLQGKKRARRIELPVFSLESLDIDNGSVGLKGSPTKVVRIENAKLSRGGTVVQADDGAGIERAIDGMMAFLKDRGII